MACFEPHRYLKLLSGKQFLHSAFARQVRVMRNYGTGYVNYCSIESAIQARERYQAHKVSELLPETVGPDAEKELHVTFTSAQQNCRRRSGLPPGAGGKGMGVGGVGGMGGKGVGGMMGGKGGFDGGKGGGKGGPALQRSRSIYVGNLPQGVSLADLSELVRTPRTRTHAHPSLSYQTAPCANSLLLYRPHHGRRCPLACSSHCDGWAKPTPF